MKYRLLKKNSSRLKTRLSACFFSLICTGLGQVYRGDFLRGFVLLLVNSLLLFYLTAACSLELHENFLIPFVSVVLMILAVKIFSMIDALVFNPENRRKMPGFKMQLLICFFYAAFAILLNFVQISAFSHYYRFTLIKNDKMSPSLKKGDICLSSLKKSSALMPGDAILNDDGFTRLIINSPAVFEIKQGRVWINGIIVPIDVPVNISSTEKSSLLYVEKYEKFSIEIYIDFSKAENQMLYSRFVCGDDEFAVLNDNRTELKAYKYTLPVAYRLDGILFSRNIGNILRSRFTVQKNQAPL